MEHNKIETIGRKDKNNFNANWPFYQMMLSTEPHYLLLCPLTKFPLVLKINYDDPINGEKYKVPVSMTVMRTQTRHGTKRRVGKKILTSRNTSRHKISKWVSL